MKKCKVNGCNNKHCAKGYCEKHYRQFKKFGHIKRTKFDPNEIISYEKYAEMALYNKDGVEIIKTIIDSEDVDKIKKYKWYLTDSGYVSTKYNGLNLRLHRLIMDCPDNMVVDHINHNTLDNRKCNLRICTQQQNSLNKDLMTNNTSGFTGVHFDRKSKNWVAQITYNYKNICLGRFDTKEEAIEARKQAEIDLFGEYRNKEDEE